MKKYLMLAMVTMVFMVSAGPVMADSVAEVFQCTLEEGTTKEDALATNGKWLAWVNANGGSGKVSSSAGTAIVGDNKAFLWIDSYPDLATWSAIKIALDTDAGKAATKDLFKGVTDCTENRLWDLELTK